MIPVSILLLHASLFGVAHAQDVAPAVTAPTPAAAPAAELLLAPMVDANIALPRDTAIRLMVMNEVTTKTARTGDRIILRVDENVRFNGQTVIPAGASAYGEVVTTDGNGSVGHAGRLSARLLYIEHQGRRIALRGDTSTKGYTATAETVLGALALGPLGLFARGNNAKIKAGDIVTGYTDEALMTDPAAGAVAAAPAAP